MAYNIITNRKDKSVVLHFTANDTVVIAGNNSVSNVAIGDEIILGAVIQQVWVGSPDGAHWVIKRANATTNSIVAVYNGTDYIDYAGAGAPINVRSSDNLRVELNANVNGYIMMELKKIGNNNFNKV